MASILSNFEFITQQAVPYLVLPARSTIKTGSAEVLSFFCEAETKLVEQDLNWFHVLRLRIGYRAVFIWRLNKNRQNEREPSFWSFNWLCEHSANTRAILLDFGRCSFDVVFWVWFWFVGRRRLCTQLARLPFNWLWTNSYSLQVHCSWTNEELTKNFLFLLLFSDEIKSKHIANESYKFKIEIALTADMLLAQIFEACLIWPLCDLSHDRMRLEHAQ